MTSMIVGLAGVAMAIGLAMPALAQSANAPPRPSPSLVDVISQGVKIRTTPREPADFVRQARKPESSLDYLPLTGARPEPTRRVMTPAEVRAKEAELDAVGRRHDAAAGRRAVPRTAKSAAAEPVVPVVKAQPKCLITCVIDSAVTTNVRTAVAPPATTP